MAYAIGIDLGPGPPYDQAHAHPGLALLSGTLTGHGKLEVAGSWLRHGRAEHGVDPARRAASHRRIPGEPVVSDQPTAVSAPAVRAGVDPGDGIGKVSQLIKGGVCPGAEPLDGEHRRGCRCVVGI